MPHLQLMQAMLKPVRMLVLIHALLARKLAYYVLVEIMMPCSTNTNRYILVLVRTLTSPLLTSISPLST